MSTPMANGRSLRTWFERQGVWAIAGLLFAAIFLFATRGEPVRANWGDPWSDGNAMTSGRYFADDGFVETAFTPILDVGPLTPDSLRYTHYPPLPDLVNGAQRSLFGEMGISDFRILADVLSLLGLVFFFRFVRRLTDPQVAGIAVALMATNLLWLQYADTIHHVPLYSCFGYLALDQAGAWLERPRPRRLWLIGVATTLCALASYDFVFYLPIMTVATLWACGKRLRDREVRPLLVAIAAGGALAVVIKFALIAWAVGLHHLVEDLKFQFFERSTTQHSTNYRAGLWPVVIGRVWRFFTPLFFVLAAVLAHSAWRRYRSGEATVSLTPLWFLAAGVPFCVVFTQLLVEQYHPTLQLLPFYVVGAATVIVAMRRHARRTWRIAGAGAFAFLLVWQVREVVRFPKVLISEHDLQEVGDHLARVDQRRFVMSNFLVDGPVRAYWHRHLMGVPALRDEDADRYFGEQFALYGNHPIRFVEMVGAVDAAYDKLLFALLSGSKRWAWIASPQNNRHKLRPRLEEMNDKLMTAIRNRGVLELSNARFRVYRIDPYVGDRSWTVPLADDALRVDLGDPSSIMHKLYGLGPSEPGPGGTAASRLNGRPEHDVRFTLQGLLTVPNGRTDRCAAIQLAVPHGARLHVRLLGPAGATITVTVNGVPLGAAATTGSWQDVAFAVAPEALTEPRRGETTTLTDIVVVSVGDDTEGDVWLQELRAEP